MSGGSAGTTSALSWVEFVQGCGIEEFIPTSVSACFLVYRPFGRDEKGARAVDFANVLARLRTSSFVRGSLQVLFQVGLKAKEKGTHHSRGSPRVSQWGMTPM